MPSNLEHEWNRILNWFRTHAPEKLDELDAPAGEEAIAAAEARLGLRFPEELRQFYRLQNGTIEFGFSPSLMADDMPYGPLPLEHIDLQLDEEEERAWAQGRADTACLPTVSPGIKPRHWSPLWIPFATNGGGDYHLVDLDPAEGGVAGQIIELRHETSERLMVAASLTELLKDVADGLDSGRYEYDGEDGLVRLEA